jgi:hypothetical protein
VTDTANLEFVTISAYLCSVLERTERTSVTAMFIQNSATSTSMKFLASKVAHNTIARWSRAAFCNLASPAIQMSNTEGIAQYYGVVCDSSSRL